MIFDTENILYSESKESLVEIFRNEAGACAWKESLMIKRSVVKDKSGKGKRREIEVTFIAILDDVLLIYV